MIYLLTAVG